MQLTGEEHASIAAARDRLASVKLGEDSSAIRQATLALDQATRRYADLQMDVAVSTVLRGKTMDAAGEELDEAITAPHAMARAEFK
jgi:vacuolar-type H+-ATPase subunit B/Vma2